MNENFVESWIGIEETANYLGVTKDVVPYIEQTSALVLPSYREGVPVSLLEAASVGRILVATNAVGCKEAVEDNVNGFLVPIKDAKALADAMRKVIEMPYEERVAMGLAGRRKVEKEFAEDKVFAVYEKVLKDYSKE